MSFISYAQNGEDVLLWRALGHIKNGFYIDVGANDPELHSVTKAFYDHGWYGINVEPLKQYQKGFEQQRPRDVNLTVAAGAEEGEITLYDVPDVPGWASADASVAHAHEQDGFTLQAHTVPLMTLSAICARHASYDIHFLKIDVEGHEEQVLRGMDFARWRPWILVIEATMPNSRETNHDTWEALVTGARYQFAYFDGLNRYYVASEHAELAAKLQVQPNVFDDFISSHLSKAWREGEAARARAQANGGWAEREQAERIAAATRADEAVARTIDTLAKLLDSEARRHQSETELRLVVADRNHTQFERDQAREAQRSADAELQHARHALAELEALRAVSVWADDLNQQLLRIHGSLAWRVTAPLRLAGRVLRAFGRGGFVLRRAGAATARSKQRARSSLRGLVRWGPVRRHVLPHLLRIPAVEQRMQRVAAALQPPHPYADGGPPVTPQLIDLPPAARKALADLERARRRSTT
ncbi:FkbM family methyltransferase [Massilia sp. TWR1-2-2]|uniref:FkbM family methyltransferase n=1 Tax=Massilia sp. TWR1-2-2 TaxID=2804584 RepID=UPI003CF2B004